MRENSNGNGAAGTTGPLLWDPRSGGADHGRQIRHDAATLAADVRGTAADLERYLTDQVKRRPYGTLGVAAGVGYVLGGGLSSRLTVMLVGTVTRLAAAFAVHELDARISQRDSTSVHKGAPEHASGTARSGHEN